MKQLLLFLALAALSVGCDKRSELRAKEISIKPATWRGHTGNAVTIRFATDTEDLKHDHRIELVFVSSERKGEEEEVFFQPVTDYCVPIMKLEPRAVTLFFGSGYDSESLDRLPAEAMTGRLRVYGCTMD